jgi:hypothetical protein
MNSAGVEVFHNAHDYKGWLEDGAYTTKRVISVVVLRDMLVVTWEHKFRK